MLIQSELERLANIPILHLNSVVDLGHSADIYVALLHTLPTDSHKVLGARSMIEEALQSQKITHQTTIVDHTTGNTGAAEAWICAMHSLNYVCFIPENMAREKIQQIKALRGEVIYTPADDFIQGAKNAAMEFQERDPDNRFYLNQAANKFCPKGYEVVGEEILKEIPGVDVFVCGGGTYSTVTGVAQTLKKAKPSVEIVLLESDYAPHIHASRNGYEAKFQPHHFIGFAPETLPGNADPDLYDSVELIEEKDAMQTMRRMHEVGSLIGKTSAGNIHWAIKIAKEMGANHSVATCTFDSFLKMVSEEAYP